MFQDSIGFVLRSIVALRAATAGGTFDACYLNMQVVPQRAGRGFTALTSAAQLDGCQQQSC